MIVIRIELFEHVAGQYFKARMEWGQTGGLCSDPWKYIRKYSQHVDPFIDSEEFIGLLQPIKDIVPRLLNFFLLFIMPILLAGAIYFAVTNIADGTYFLIAVGGLVFGYVIIVTPTLICSLLGFYRKSEKHIDHLNSTVMAAKGLVIEMQVYGQGQRARKNPRYLTVRRREGSFVGDGYRPPQLNDQPSQNGLR